MQDTLNAYYQTQTRAFAKIEQNMLIESISLIEKNPQLGQVFLEREDKDKIRHFCENLSFYPDLSGFAYTWLVRNLQFIFHDGVDAFVDSMNKN